MKYKSLGRSSIKISEVIMGTWQAGMTGFKGKSQWLGIEGNEIAKALAADLGKTLKIADC